MTIPEILLLTGLLALLVFGRKFIHISSRSRPIRIAVLVLVALVIAMAWLWSDASLAMKVLLTVIMLSGVWQWYKERMEAQAGAPGQ